MITSEDKAKCAERELRMRERVYPRWIAAGKMKPQQAEHEIETMRAIADDYRAKAQAEGAERLI
jgi:hypothetical protein